MTDWIDLADFFHMGGHGLYVWGSLGMCAAALGAEVLALRLRRLALSKAPALADPTDRGPHEALR